MRIAIICKNVLWCVHEYIIRPLNEWMHWISNWIAWFNNRYTAHWCLSVVCLITWCLFMWLIMFCIKAHVHNTEFIPAKKMSLCEPLCLHGLALILAWIRNHMPSKMSVEISYSSPNFSRCTLEVWEWVSNSIPYLWGIGKLGNAS